MAVSNETFGRLPRSNSLTNRGLTPTAEASAATVRPRDCRLVRSSAAKAATASWGGDLKGT